MRKNMLKRVINEETYTLELTKIETLSLYILYLLFCILFCFIILFYSLKLNVEGGGENGGRGALMMPPVLVIWYANVITNNVHVNILDRRTSTVFFLSSSVEYDNRLFSIKFSFKINSHWLHTIYSVHGNLYLLEIKYQKPIIFFIKVYMKISY